MAHLVQDVAVAVRPKILVTADGRRPCVLPNGSLSFWAHQSDQPEGVSLAELTAGDWVSCCGWVREVLSRTAVGDTYHVVTQGRERIKPVVSTGTRRDPDPTKTLITAAGVINRMGGRTHRRLRGPTTGP
jgi:hypothetical protein